MKLLGFGNLVSVIFETFDVRVRLVRTEHHKA